MYFETIYGGQEPRRNRVVEPARRATQPGGIMVPWNRFFWGPLKFENSGLEKAVHVPDFVQYTVWYFLVKIFHVLIYQ